MAEKIVTEKECDWGCGKKANYYFPYSKKYCCGHNVSKCPNKIKLQLENTDYDRIHTKKLKTLNDRYGVSNVSQIKEVREKISKTKKTIVDGETKAKISSKKMVETRRNKFDETTGLDSFKTAGIKQSITKTNDIDANGFNMHQRSGKAGKLTRDEKGYDSYKTPEFRNKISIISKKFHEERLNDIDEYGDNYYTRRTKSCLERDINYYDNIDKKRNLSYIKLKYLDTSLHYQGGYELKWLDYYNDIYGLDWIKKNIDNGPYFKYFDSTTSMNRYYISDFIIGNTVYEIKSSWTWDKKGADENLRKKNEDKLNAVKLAGYNVILVLNHEEIKI